MDLVAFGELLVDFTPTAPRTFFANPGGAPANVLAAATRLGLRTAFIGMVGDDGFGHMLEADLKKVGVDTTGLRYTQTACTTLAFVQLNESGDRSFTFVRKPGADTMLRGADVDYNLINNARAFHFGSLSLTDEPSRSATFQAVLCAKNNGLLISYDPNLRPLLWANMEEAKEYMLEGMGLADIVKVSGEELEFLTGISDIEAGAAALQAMGPALVLVTLGPAGCAYHTGTHFARQPTYDLVVQDTTGAGDAFIGAVLTYILSSKKPLATMLVPAILDKMVEYAGAVSALATTKPGGISSMPSPEEVARCMQQEPKLIL